MEMLGSNGELSRWERMMREEEEWELGERGHGRPRGVAELYGRARGPVDHFEELRRGAERRGPWREEKGTWEEPITWERGGQGGNRSYGMEIRVRKLKMTVFEDGNVDDWINKVERYFAVNGLSEEERLVAAGMCLEGAAFSWYKYMDRKEPVRSWREFKWAIRDRFRGSSPSDLAEQFYSPTQEGTVEEYRKKFEGFVGDLEDLPDSTLGVNFLKGLKPEIRDTVKVMRPRSLREAMELAQLVENQKVNVRGWRNTSLGGSIRTTTTCLASKGPNLSSTKEVGKEKGVVTRPGGGFKKLTEAEMQKKRAKGLCFRCDERFSPGHRCKDRTLQALTVYIDEAPEEGDDEEQVVE